MYENTGESWVAQCLSMVGETPADPGASLEAVWRAYGHPSLWRWEKDGRRGGWEAGNSQLMALECIVLHRGNLFSQQVLCFLDGSLWGNVNTCKDNRQEFSLGIIWFTLNENWFHDTIAVLVCFCYIQAVVINVKAQTSSFWFPTCHCVLVSSDKLISRCDTSDGLGGWRCIDRQVNTNWRLL